MTSAFAASVGLLSNSTFQNSVSEKRTGPMRPVPSLGNAQHGTMRRNEGDGKMNPNQMAQWGNMSSPGTYVVPANEHEAAQEFSAIILPFSRGDLAQAGKRCKDAAKRWKAGEVLPSAWAMMNLGQSIAPVRNWYTAKMGRPPMPEFLTPQVLTTMMAALYQVAHQPGPDGEAARDALRQLSGIPRP